MYCGHGPVNRIDPSGLSYVPARIYAEARGFEVDWVENWTDSRTGYTYAIAYFTLDGHTGRFSGRIVDGRMMFDPAFFNWYFGLEAVDMIDLIWDPATINRIRGLHPEIQDSATWFILDAQNQGINLRITSGYRSFAEQDAIWQQGRDAHGNRIPGQSVYTNARGGQSWHNFGLAFDVVEIRPHAVTGLPTAIWNGYEAADGLGENWSRIGAIGESHGFEWGGRWTSFPDRPHFQMTFGLTLAELRQRRTQEDMMREDGFVKVQRHSPIITRNGFVR